MRLSKLGEIFLIWLIIFFGMILRTYKADFYPIHNNDDSLFHVWAGTSSFKNIIKPASLSIFTQNNKSLFWYSQYNHFDTIRRFSFRLTQPYFDQPPLAMFFIALPAKILGFNDFVQVPHLLVRLPALLMSIFSLYLTYILAKKTFNQKTAFFSLLVYTLTPIFVFSHRLAYLENFLTPIFLFSLIKLKDYLKKPSKFNLSVLIFLGFISGFVKIIGFGLPFILAFWLFKNKKTKQTFYLVLTGFLSFLSYLLYGFLVNWQQFKFTLQAQSGRGMYLTSFFHILNRVEFYEPFNDGIYILGFIMALFLLIKSLKNKKLEFFSLNFLFWLVLIIITSGVNNNSYWYRYPLFPFLSMALGYYLNLILKKPTIISVFPLLLLGFTSPDLLELNPNTLFLRISYLLFLSPFLVKYLFPHSKKIKWLCHRLTIALIILMFLINALVPLKYLSKKCQKDDCLIPTKIIVSP
ncbi:hypothetical protein COT75_01840 [Candidatus Beckwithbacteria bacterium CG10_big_fil_rev_8_21_14_0_10_34_10]|uniref:Glycosyltransferase RgtA/B/C/D-like domain-containing protein n=1 Tax=Candidatus Beckwithbacteria bacterium CG10_big_fil_rev_8_21_14_0_10_34_10 TaxID=1974495 RepID=A0A2H0W9Q6_9BACT|nr:MAG: hypothetical protein COT75_01840 [Candidatus Beckwithbacteria bacterium CG10_big_fil_rev_8_21_14_0_10_34_10]